VTLNPFAPATHPDHPKNVGRAPERDDAPARLDALMSLHRTPHEEQADQTPDADELERRDTLVTEFREELEEHGEAQNPTLVDLTGEDYVWQEGDEDTDSYWAHASVLEDDEPAEDEKPVSKRKPARKRKPAAKLDEALAKLDGDK